MNSEYDTDTNAEWGNENALVPTETDTVMVRADSAPLPLPLDELPDLDDMEPGFSLAMNYVKFTEVGQSLRGVLIGWNDMQSKQGGTKPVAILQNHEGIFANAGDNLVSQLKNVPRGTPVVITYKGETRTQTGNNVKVFDVRVLNKRVAGATPAPSQAPAPKPNGAPAPQVGNFGPGVQTKGATKESYFAFANAHGIGNIAVTIRNKYTRNGVTDWDKALNDLIPQAK